MRITSRNKEFLSKNERKLLSRIEDSEDGRVELRNAYEIRWATKLSELNFIEIEGDGAKTFAFIPMKILMFKIFDGSFDKDMNKNFTTSTDTYPDILSAVSSGLSRYKENLLGVEYADISDHIK